jgi:hypothetical protein
MSPNELSWERRVRDVLQDPAASWWLKGCLAGAVRFFDQSCNDYNNRDPVDVANDLDVLNDLLREWLKRYGL